MFTSYQHIFDDFNIDKADVKWQVLILCAICLENAEIKSRNDEELIYDKLTKHKKQFYVEGLISPDNKLDFPVTLLVPHFFSQVGNKSMCFSNVVTFVESLYIASVTHDNDKVGSPIRK